MAPVPVTPGEDLLPIAVDAAVVPIGIPCNFNGREESFDRIEPGNDGTPGASANTRIRRSKYSNEQVARLSSAFEVSSVLSKHRTLQLSTECGLSIAQVKAWFARRRIRARQDQVDGAPSLCKSQVFESMEVDNTAKKTVSLESHHDSPASSSAKLNDSVCNAQTQPHGFLTSSAHVDTSSSMEAPSSAPMFTSNELEPTCSRDGLLYVMLTVTETPWTIAELVKLADATHLMADTVGLPQMKPPRSLDYSFENALKTLLSYKKLEEYGARGIADVFAACRVNNK